MSRASESAYPINEKNDYGEHFFTHRGMTIREAYIMAAMQGVLSNPNLWDQTSETLAGMAINDADATLKAAGIEE